MIPDDPCFTILEEGRDQLQELKVTFFPPLYQQRRMWLLDLLRREEITDVRYRVILYSAFCLCLRYERSEVSIQLQSDSVHYWMIDLTTLICVTII